MTRKIVPHGLNWKKVFEIRSLEEIKIDYMTPKNFHTHLKELNPSGITRHEVDIHRDTFDTKYQSYLNDKIDEWKNHLKRTGELIHD